MSVIREDAKGLFVIAGGYVARPGNVGGYDHAYKMGSGGLKKGDHVKTHHLAGSPITKITLPDQCVLHWHHDDSDQDK